MRYETHSRFSYAHSALLERAHICVALLKFAGKIMIYMHTYKCIYMSVAISIKLRHKLVGLCQSYPMLVFTSAIKFWLLRNLCESLAEWGVIVDGPTLSSTSGSLGAEYPGCRRNVLFK